MAIVRLHAESYKNDTTIRAVDTYTVSRANQSLLHFLSRYSTFPTMRRDEHTTTLPTGSSEMLLDWIRSWRRSCNRENSTRERIAALYIRARVIIDDDDNARCDKVAIMHICETFLLSEFAFAYTLGELKNNSKWFRFDFHALCKRLNNPRAPESSVRCIFAYKYRIYPKREGEKWTRLLSTWNWIENELKIYINVCIYAYREQGKHEYILQAYIVYSRAVNAIFIIPRSPST